MKWKLAGRNHSHCIQTKDRKFKIACNLSDIDFVREKPTVDFEYIALTQPNTASNVGPCKISKSFPFSRNILPPNLSCYWAIAYLWSCLLFQGLQQKGNEVGANWHIGFGVIEFGIKFLHAVYRLALSLPMPFWHQALARKKEKKRKNELLPKCFFH